MGEAPPLWGDGVVEKRGVGGGRQLCPEGEMGKKKKGGKMVQDADTREKKKSGGRDHSQKKGGGGKGEVWQPVTEKELD